MDRGMYPGALGLPPKSKATWATGKRTFSFLTDVVQNQRADVVGDQRADVATSGGNR